MLKSAGYFKTLPCPFFAENESCARPFCHYKHETKKLENNEKRKSIDGKFFKNRY